MICNASCSKLRLCFQQATIQIPAIILVRNAKINIASVGIYPVNQFMEQIS